MPQIILDEGDVGHCSICPLVFSPKCLVTCQLCGQILENAERVSHHLELAHHGNSWMEVGVQKQDKLKCDLCLDLFFSRPLLEEHVIVAHLKEATVKIKNSQCYCNFCGKDFKNVQILMKHEQKCEARIKIVPDLMLGLSNKKTTLAKDVVMTCNKDKEVEEDSVSQDDFRYDDEDDDPMEDFEEMDLKKQEDLESNVNQDDFHYNDDDPMEDFAEIDLEKQENPKSNVEEAIRKLDNTSVTFEMISLPKKEVQLEDVTVRPIVQDPEVESYLNCCPHCPRKFKSDMKAHNHIVKEHYEEQMNELQGCQECKYEALDESFMFKHFSAKHKQNIVKYPNLICKLCSLFFKEESNLTNHKVEKHKGLGLEGRRKSSIPGICNKTVKKSSICKICSKSLSSLSSLRRHYLSRHPEALDARDCPCCETMHIDDSSMFRHMKQWHKKDMKNKKISGCICFPCKLMFKTAEDFKVHHQKQNHEEQKGKNFISPGKSPGESHCKLCNTTVRWYSLNRHLLDNHPETVDARKCIFCNITPINEKIMFRHMCRCHKQYMEKEEVRELICRPCQKMYKTKEEKQQHHEEFHGSQQLAIKDNYLSTNTTCKECRKSFKNIYFLMSHYSRIHPEVLDVRKCPFCKKKPIDNEWMFRHMKHYHKIQMVSDDAIQKLICRPCHMMFKTEAECSKHKESHEAVNKEQLKGLDLSTTTCKFCKESFKDIYILRNHYSKYHSEVLEVRKCPFCDKKPIDNEWMFRHMKHLHRIKMESDLILKLICRPCSMIFKTEAECSEHIESHEAADQLQLKELKGEDNSEEAINENHDILDLSTATCKLCIISFEKFSDLKGHMINVHPTVIKLFPCDQCDDQCLSSAKLEKHYFFKHEEKARGFVKGKTCTSCNKTFVSHEQAMKHAQRHWETITCEFCGKIIPKTSFYIHTKYCNPKEEIIQCEHCNYRGKKFNLKMHIAYNHTERTPSICDVCGKIFMKGEIHMKSHRVNVHGKILNCKFCDLKMYSKALNSHMRLKHRVGVRKDCHICDFNATDNKTFLEHLEKQHSLVDQKLEKIYKKCHFCHKVINKAFVEQHTLEFCEKTEVTCEICGKVCVNVQKMNSHIHRDHPLESKKKEISCETCGKSFVNTKTKKRHINHIHLGIPRPKKNLKKNARKNLPRDLIMLSQK